ncbi:MAG: hypothetical protein IJI20_01690 [Firmicutes bacterium]|nr:hypothetical protein [Bacillota bacterium]
MIVIAGGVQAEVRIDMTMPGKPEPAAAQGGGEISPWEKEAYGEGGRFGSMTSIPSGDPMKDRITVSFTGCAYHAAKYLAEKGHEVAFVSVVGEDPLGLAALADLEKSGVDISGVVTISELGEDPDEKATPAGDDSPETAAKKDPGEVREVAAQTIPGNLKGSLTSVRVVARNFLGDVEFWRVDERILKEITPRRLASAEEKFAGADMVFADGNLPGEAIGWIGEFCREKGLPLYFDPSSPEGSARGADMLEYFRGIMPGRREAEAMSGLGILSTDQLMEAGRHFTEQGVGRVIITMKGGGLYYKEGLEEGVLRPQRVLRFAETGGAGDVVTAELLHGFARGIPMEEAAQAAMDAAAEYLADVVDERRY